jgi:hypothetical protein
MIVDRKSDSGVVLMRQEVDVFDVGEFIGWLRSDNFVIVLVHIDEVKKIELRGSMRGVYVHGVDGTGEWEVRRPELGDEEIDLFGDDIYTADSLFSVSEAQLFLGQLFGVADPTELPFVERL